MLRKIYLLLATALVLVAAKAQAQVSVDIRIDSLQLLVGEQTGITLEVSCDKGQQVQFPVLTQGQELVPDVEVVKIMPIDTTVPSDGRMTLSQKYVVTAWDSSFYYLPPMEVLVDGKKMETKSLALKVATMEVDTLHTDQFFGPKEEMTPPFVWEDWRLVVLGAFILVLLILAMVFVYVSVKTGLPIIQIIRRKPKKLAHQVALDEIEKIKQERIWAQEDSKEYYTQLTDTLRTYIQERYGFNAMEMTSTEIIERLTEEDDQQALDELRELFQTADLVKFAKHSTLINENDANLVTALDYINQTKQEIDPQAQVEETVPPEVKRRKVTVITMRAFIIVTTIVAVVLLGFVIYRVVDLLN